jgi:hypothetical protein
MCNQGQDALFICDASHDPMGDTMRRPEEVPLSRHHPSRLRLLPAALSVVFALASCGSPIPSGPGSADPVTGSPGSGATPDGGSTAVGLSRFSGTSEDVKYTFDHPSGWTVQDAATGGPPGSGAVSVLAPDGTVMASLTILVAWGAECPCVERPAVHLGDVAGVAPLSKSGAFVVRSMALDLTDFPADRTENQWADNVKVVTSLSMDAGPPPAALVPRLMYGLGLAETGVLASNGITYRTVLFTATRDFSTLADARAYAASEEHRRVQEMIASFREGTA